MGKNKILIAASDKNNPLLPIGAVIKVNKNNIHVRYVKAGSKAKIVEYTDYRFKTAYVVSFFNKKHKDLNDKGPIISDNCIIWTPAMKVLYGSQK